MLFLGKIAGAPVNGFMTVMQKIADRVDEERSLARADAMTNLMELHRRLEAGEISEEEFDAAEEAYLELIEQSSEEDQ